MISCSSNRKRSRCPGHLGITFAITLIVRVGDVAEAFLPGSVPNLQLNLLAINSHGFEAKVDSDGT